ncbi:uncharacterized protein isoform X1 [Rhodnius prolixus]|uniref:uncharacterized protein isoform X1 n=1 Tax=Rhodnius prolixus TaxID=13249 RepID=UPI003D18A700
MECEDQRCSGQILGTVGTGRRKLDDEDVPPPELPPRPAACPRHAEHHRAQSSIEGHLTKKRLKKYVFLCTVCGGLASLLGGLFLGVYLILRSYTSSLDYFETIPTYIPASMLLLTGLGIMCLARRKNRYAVLIKLCGVCCLICAATCVLVTVTTTVIHMSRLQSLRECVYTTKTQTCTCYSMLLESASERTDEGAHYVFNSTPDCEVIHGALYSCLRAMFGLSVIGILVCIFCCMLVYQLLSHERKKMYWEQLELRCRYLYGQPTRNQPVITPPQRCSHCACSQQFRYPVEGTFDNRLWAGGRIGNLYSPNPVGDEPAANSGGSGWAWRLPWSRSDNSQQVQQPSETRESVGYNQPLNCSSPDSQYGFTTQGVATVSSATSASYTMIEAPPQQVYQWGPPPPYSDPNSPRRACAPGPQHTCPSRQGHAHEYLNIGETEHEESRTLRGRRLGDSSSSSAKSDERNNQRIEQSVSPRAKYQRQPQTNPAPRKRPDLTESEVYFADVSSCCNGSVRNDSLLYDEPLAPGENEAKLQRHPHGLSFRKDIPPKQPRFGPDKNLRSHIQESSKEFQKIPEERGSPEAYSEMAHDGSEEDDPELVSFSQRNEGRNRISDLTRSQCRNRMDLSQMNQDFPSPMSISSPSTGSKDFFPDTNNSDNGSADSVWSGCSPDFLAPDAQYETIPEHRMRNESISGSSKLSPSKRRVLATQDWHNYQEPEPVVFIQNINSPRSPEVKASKERPRNSPRIRRNDVNDKPGPFDPDVGNFEPEMPDFCHISRCEKTGRENVTSSQISNKYNPNESSISNFDRCGNLSQNYYDDNLEQTTNSPNNFQRYTNSEGVHSPRHHYEEIKENMNTPHYETCTTTCTSNVQQPFARHHQQPQQQQQQQHHHSQQHHHQQQQQQHSSQQLQSQPPPPQQQQHHHQQPINSSQDFCTSSKKDGMTINNTIDSPKIFEKCIFTNSALRSSPECIALVDESQCSHNDSSCRCSLSLNKCVTDDSNN